MKHTPYGYDIVGGAAVINEEQAAAIRQTCENYLSGMSMTQAAGAAGINATYSVVKKLMLNPRYLGDEFYPAILSIETHQAVEAERQRRHDCIPGRNADNVDGVQRCHNQKAGGEDYDLR